MHIQTHVMSGWCLGNLFDLDARERLFCILAACLQDLDGVTYFMGEKAWADYHHLLGHNLLVCVVLAGVMTVFSTHRVKAFAIYLGLGHLHLLMDYWGSGFGWPVHYWWPFYDWMSVSERGYINPRAWPLYSWQNLTTGCSLIVWTLVIAVRQRRTPLEIPMPRLDVQLVDWLTRRWTSIRGLFG